MDKRYPVGTFAEALATPTDYDADVREIASFLERVKTAVGGLSAKQLRQRYRPGSWDISQVVHHCADSHATALLRVKRALTEDTPTIQGYDQDATAQLPDYGLPLAPSLALLEGLHARFAALLSAISPEQRRRAYFHAGEGRAFSVAEAARVYAWHGRHHLAHIKLASMEPA